MNSLFRLVMQKIRSSLRKARSRSESASSCSEDKKPEPSETNRASQRSQKSQTSRKSTESQSNRSLQKRKSISLRQQQQGSPTSRTLHSNLSPQRSADTLSTSSSRSLCAHSLVGVSALNIQTTALASGATVTAWGQQFAHNSYMKTEYQQPGGSNESSSHQSSLADYVPELPLLNSNCVASTVSTGASAYSVCSALAPSQPTVSSGANEEQSQSLPNLSHSQQQLTLLPDITYPLSSSPSLLLLPMLETLNVSGDNKPTNFTSNTPAFSTLIVDSEEQNSNPADEDSQASTDTESVISNEITIDLTKGYRSKSLDASVVLAMARANNLNAGIKPRSSAPFLEIPKWRLFIRKPSSDSASGAFGHTVERAPIMLTDIFRECAHCKCLMDLKRLQPQSSAALDAFCLGGDTDKNNNDVFLRRNPLPTISQQFQSQLTPSLSANEEKSPSSFDSSNILATTKEIINLDENASINSRLFRKHKPLTRKSRYFCSVASQSDLVATPITTESESLTPILISDTALESPTQLVESSQDKPCVETKLLTNLAFSLHIVEKQTSFSAQPARRLPSVTLSEASDDEQTPLSSALGDLLQVTTDCFGLPSTTPCIGIQVTDTSLYRNEDEIDDPGSGITVISLEVPLLSASAGKQARSASVDSSFLQVPPRPDIGSCELPPTKSSRSRSVDIALPEGPDGPYLVVPSANQRPITTK